MRKPLKELNEIFQPDPRSTAFVKLDAAGEHPRTIEDHREDIAAIKMSDRVPASIRGEFDTVRNLFLYSWYVYEFTFPAILYAHVLIEKTIKEKCTLSSVALEHGLSRLLQLSIREGWLINADFEYARNSKRCEIVLPADQEHEPSLRSSPRYLPTETDYCEHLAETLPKVRNLGAHGDTWLDFPGGALRHIDICASIANALFRDTPDAASSGG